GAPPAGISSRPTPTGTTSTPCSPCCAPFTATARSDAMRILHITGSHGESGAAKGVINLHRALRSLGADSLLALARPPGLEGAVAVENSLGRRLLGRLFRLRNGLLRARYGLPRDPTFSLCCNGHDPRALVARTRPDIIHLH